MKLHFLFLSLFVLLAGVAKAAPPTEEGKAIFATRCASCHNINKVLTGPALAGVDERHSIDWIVAFVQSSQSLIKKGDKEALALYEKFNNIPMPDHPDLTADNIKNIVAYIKAETKAVSEEKVPFEKPAKLRPAYIPLSLKKDAGFFLGFLGVVALLIIVLLFAVQLKQYERIV
jgi:mono/diheme cytochrome c family protein